MGKRRKRNEKGVKGTKHTSLHHIYYTRARSLEKRFLKRKKRTKKLASDTIVVLVFQRAFEEEREAFCRAAFKKKSVVVAFDTKTSTTRVLWLHRFLNFP